ncbi:hypothetical protein UlMin_006767 [Ulmus minor]
MTDLPPVTSVWWNHNFSSDLSKIYAIIFEMLQNTNYKFFPLKFIPKIKSGTPTTVFISLISILCCIIFYSLKKCHLRAAINSHARDIELCIIIDNVTAHFNDIFWLKGIAAKADVFHILFGMWKTPAERCFMWIGGFRSSELLKLLVNQLEPLTEQQLIGIYNLQQSSQQAKNDLSQGMEALQQSLAETLTSGSLGPSVSSGNVANYMGQIAMAMGKLGTLEGFLRQVISFKSPVNDYISRLRALNSLWLARPCK